MKTLTLIAVIALYSTSLYAKGTIPRPQSPTNAPRAIKTQMRGTQTGNCPSALMACDELVQAQDASIKTLKKQVEVLEDSLASASDTGPTTLVVGLIGFIAGSVATVLLVK